MYHRIVSIDDQSASNHRPIVQLFLLTTTLSLLSERSSVEKEASSGRRFLYPFNARPITLRGSWRRPLREGAARVVRRIGASRAGASARLAVPSEDQDRASRRPDWTPHPAARDVRFLSRKDRSAKLNLPRETGPRRTRRAENQLSSIWNINFVPRQRPSYKESISSARRAMSVDRSTRSFSRCNKNQSPHQPRVSQAVMCDFSANRFGFSRAFQRCASFSALS